MATDRERSNAAYRKYYRDHPEYAARMAQRRRRQRQNALATPAGRAKELERGRERYRRLKPKSHARSIWWKQHPDARRAHKVVAAAIKRGDLIRPEVCSRCGQGGTIQAHHADYSRPLGVEWLCKPCHGLTWRKRS